MAIEDIRLLKIEQKIKLDTGGSKECLSKVADVTGDGIIILPPVYKGRARKVEIGDSILVTFWTRSNLFKFKSQVRGIIESPIASILIDKPGDVARIQRRQYYRMAISNIPFYYAKGTISGEFAEGRLHDISGGGLSFTVRGDDSLDEATNLTIKLTLSNGDIRMKGQITRRILLEKGKKNLYRYCVEFVNIDEVVRDKIIRFVFDKQAEERKLLKHTGS